LVWQLEDIFSTPHTNLCDWLRKMCLRASDHVWIDLSQVMTSQNIFIYTGFLHYDYYIVLIFLVEFYIISPSTLILPSCVHSYHIDLRWQTNYGRNWMSPFKKQNVTTALNMTTFKYRHLIIGKIIRTLINSTEYIKLISPHFPSTLSFQTTWTSKPPSWTTFSSSPRLLKPILVKCPFFTQGALKQYTIEDHPSLSAYFTLASPSQILMTLGLHLSTVGTPKFSLCSFLQLVIYVSGHMDLRPGSANRIISCSIHIVFNYVNTFIQRLLQKLFKLLLSQNFY